MILESRKMYQMDISKKITSASNSHWSGLLAVDKLVGVVLLWIREVPATIGGTKVGLGFINVSRDPCTMPFPFLSRLAFSSKHFFVPRCLFVRFEIPTVPQLTRIPQSGQVAYPSWSISGTFQIY